MTGMNRFLVALAMLLPAPVHAVAAPPVIYLAGDSTAATVYLPAGDQFRARLAERLPDGTTVISVACSGQRLIAGTTATTVTGCASGSQPSLVSQWPLILAATPKPTTIVLGPFGINDMGCTDDATWETAYLGLLDQAAAAGVRVVSSTMAPVNTDWANYAKVCVPGYATPATARYWMNQWLVARYGAAGMFRPDLALQNPDGSLSRWYAFCNGCQPGAAGDGIHPNAYGAVRMADAVPLERLT